MVQPEEAQARSLAKYFKNWNQIWELSRDVFLTYQ